MLWKIGTGGLRLLATCHVLQANDYPISTCYESAYMASSVVFFEADMRASEIQGFGLSSGDDTLFHQAPQLYREVEATLIELGHDVLSLPHSKPWHAWIRLIFAFIQHAGFEYRYAIDRHLFERAETDQKTVGFLETPWQQFVCYDSLPIPAQIDQLTLFLANRADIAHQMHRIVNGWRNSDESELVSVLEECLRRAPELYQCLIIGRNHNWLPRLEQLSLDTTPTLVCVGFLHCVGQVGLPALLAARGVQPIPITHTSRSQRGS